MAVENIKNLLVPVHLIKPHERNYRSHPDTQLIQLEASHSRFGQFRSLVLWERPHGEYITVAGHGILEAMKRNGATEVRADVLPQDTSQETIDGILVADNLHSQDATDDEVMLAEILEEQKNAGYDLASLGTDDEALRQMLEALGDEYAGGTGDDEEDEMPEIEEEQTRVRLGDVWKLGRHKLIVGDSLNFETLKTLMGNEQADMLLCDPPYGMNFDPGMSVRETRKGDWVSKPRYYDKVIGDDKDFDPCPLMEQFAYCKEQFWWGADYYADKIPDRNDGAWFVWDKREGIEDIEFSTAAFELCWSRQKHARQIVRQRWMGLMGTETQDVRSRVHPTQKPLQVCNFFIEKYSEPDALVVDLFLGSGTTLVSCEKLGRRCFGIELLPKFADVILTRWEKETAQTAELIERLEVS